MQTSFSRAQTEHRQLLFNVKSLAEQLLLNNKATAANHPDGSATAMQNADEVALLHDAVEQIFVHGVRMFKPDQSPDMWPFIEGLNWLNPAMTVSVGNASFKQHDDALQSAHTAPKPAGRVRSDKALLWIFQNLASNQLIYKLQYLVSDTEHLNSCYEVWAFLQSAKYLNAFLLCLRAIECNQPNLLTQIEPSLLCTRSDHVDSLPKTHKRSTSHPHFSLIPAAVAPALVQPTTLSRIKQKSQSLEHQPNTRPVLRAWRSLPNIQAAHLHSRPRSKTIQTIRGRHKHCSSSNLVLINQQVPEFSYPVSTPTAAATNVPDLSELRLIQLIKCDDIKIHEHSSTATPPNASDVASYGSEPSSFASTNGRFSFMLNWSTGDKSNDATSPSSYLNLLAAPAPADFINAFVPKEGEKLVGRAAGSVGSLSPIFNAARNYAVEQHEQTPTASSSPRTVQSLTSFLQTGHFSRVNNELERENAHFSVSEAMISAIEQMKCKRVIDYLVGERLPCRARFTEQVSPRTKRRPVQDDLQTGCRVARNTNDKYRHTVMSNSSSASSSLTSSCSSPTPSRSYMSPHRAARESALAARPTKDDTSATPTASTHSLNDECQAYAEWGGNAIENWSAESVALSLISKFSDQQMPRTCDLLWLVSEHDAPQTLLPMPSSWAVNPDEPHKIPFTRGTRDWAPPRAQVIFTRHEKVDRKALLRKQNQRCAGCGMKVAAAYSHRFRYCDYLGRFHCTNCHRNQMSVIPARVLDRWDFASYSVSVFAYRLLEEIWDYPLFRVAALTNGQLYVRAKPLLVARRRRAQMQFLRDFVVSCRFAADDGTKGAFEAVASHIVNDIDLWSMADFTAVRLGSFIKDINRLFERCEKHVLCCELCMARGFICECCTRKQTIFPWQNKVRRCAECGVCVHESCWTDDCAKCDRLRRRQQHVATPLSRLTPQSVLGPSRSA